MNDTLKTIHGLRSTRKFSSKEIGAVYLEKILNACVRAANASGRQSYSIIVVRDSEVIKEVLNYEGDKALIFCVDYNRVVETAEHLGHSFSVEGVKAFITGSTDAILAAQTAAIAARSLGIDSFFTNSVHRGDMKRVYERFELPERYCFPLISLIMGYSTEEPKHLKGRLKGKGVIHYDRYHRLTDEELDEIVRMYDDPDEHMGAISDWREKGFQHYLDWFYAVWSVRDKRDISEKLRPFYALLDRAGFLDAIEG